jgi:hypothetical protein
VLFIRLKGGFAVHQLGKKVNSGAVTRLFTRSQSCYLHCPQSIQFQENRMRSPAAAVSVSEGVTSECALLRQESPLRAAKGFVLAGALSGAFWTLAGILAWCLV